jgi:hypothetical protein
MQPWAPAFAGANGERVRRSLNRSSPRKLGSRDTSTDASILMDQALAARRGVMKKKRPPETAALVFMIRNARRQITTTLVPTLTRS